MKRLCTLFAALLLGACSRSSERADLDRAEQLLCEIQQANAEYLKRIKLEVVFANLASSSRDQLLEAETPGEVAVHQKSHDDWVDSHSDAWVKMKEAERLLIEKEERAKRCGLPIRRNSIILERYHSSLSSTNKALRLPRHPTEQNLRELKEATEKYEQLSSLTFEEILNQNHWATK